MDTHKCMSVFVLGGVEEWGVAVYVQEWMSATLPAGKRQFPRISLSQQISTYVRLSVWVSFFYVNVNVCVCACVSATDGLHI